MLFDVEDLISWAREWQNMPSFVNEDLAPKFSIIVNFACAADVDDFATLIGQRVSTNINARQLPSIWVPSQEIGRMVNRRYAGQ